jgi:hypothetical protein
MTIATLKRIFYVADELDIRAVAKLALAKTDKQMWAAARG